MATDELWELDRIRLMDGVPLILELLYVVRRHCPKLACGNSSVWACWPTVRRQ